jgi:hypothetical protein
MNILLTIFHVLRNFEIDLKETDNSIETVKKEIYKKFQQNKCKS